MNNHEHSSHIESYSCCKAFLALSTALFTETQILDPGQSSPQDDVADKARFA